VLAYTAAGSGSFPADFGDDVLPPGTEITFDDDASDFPSPLAETISFSVVGDTLDEQDERFTVEITGLREVDQDDEEGEAIPTSDDGEEEGEIVLVPGDDDANVTIIDNDPPTPRPVHVFVERFPTSLAGADSIAEADDVVLVRATGLVPGDGARVEVRRITASGVETRTVTLPNPATGSSVATVSFNDCRFERDEEATYEAIFVELPTEAPITTLHVNVPAATIVNDDSERPCSSLVFYNFERPSFVSPGEDFTFTNEPTFIAPVPLIVDANGRLAEGGTFTATPLTHKELLTKGVGVF
jgi:hypothetical protein